MGTSQPPIRENFPVSPFLHAAYIRVRCSPCPPSLTRHSSMRINMYLTLSDPSLLLSSLLSYCRPCHFLPKQCDTHPRCNWFWCWQRSNQLLFIVSFWSRTLPFWCACGDTLVLWWAWLSRENGEKSRTYVPFITLLPVALYMCAFAGPLARNFDHQTLELRHEELALSFQQQLGLCAA